MKPSFKCIFFLFIVLYAMNGAAQNPVWTLPNNLFDVIPNQLSTLPTGPSFGYDYSGQQALGNHNAMCDENGDLLFFVVDNKVYDKDGYFIDEMQGVEGPVLGGSELAIVPHPTDCRKYIIFSTCNYYQGIEFSEPFYSILDISQPNINQANPNLTGALQYDNTGNNAFRINNLLGTSSIVWVRTMPGYAITALRSDNSRFIFLYNGKGSIYRLKITSTGNVVYDNYAFFLPGNNISPNSLEMRSEFEVYETPGGGYRLAGTYTDNVNGPTVFIVSLDATGVLINGSQHYYSYPVGSGTSKPYIHGLEFSPLGNHLYITHEVQSPYLEPIQYIDFSNFTLNNLNVTGKNEFQYSYIEKDVNGNLVFVNNLRLSSLSNPDNPNPANWNYNHLTGISYNLTSQSWGGGLYSAYVLPDQIDGENYPGLFNSVSCCINFAANYDQDVFTAHTDANFPSATQVWTPNNNPLNGGTGANASIKEKIVIPAGYTIRIQGMNIQFAPELPPNFPGAKLEIQQGTGSLAGGKVILDNTTLTVDPQCGIQKMWQGVQVWGVQNQLQTPYTITKQGRLEMVNNSVIEHALTAVLLGRSNNYPYQPDVSLYGYNGGIIRATNSTFRNNVYDVIFRDYETAVSQSYFTNCQFITTSALYDPSRYPVYHTWLANMNGVRFTGCDFENQIASDNTPVGQLGWGINAQNSMVTIQSGCTTNFYPCPNPDRTNFKNLRYGIYATSTNILRNTICTEAVFTNNRYAVSLNGMNSAVITKNDFYIYKAAALNPAGTVWGLWMSSCSGYTVQENTFQDVNHPTISAIGNSYGIIVTNSGSDYNLIYKNTFRNLKIGGQSQGINADFVSSNIPLNIPPNILGLHWECNTFEDAITNDLTVTSGRIAYHQGYCYGNDVTTPAGNYFDQSSYTTQPHIIANNTVTPLNYASHDYSSVPNPYYPYNVTIPIVSREICTTVFPGNSTCLSKLGLQHRISELTNNVKEIKTEITTLKNQIDGGNTSAVIAYIHSNESPGKKRIYLLGLSPYLSDEVLIEYIYSNPPNGHLQQVLLANSGITQQVWEVLDAKSIPQGIKNSVSNAMNIKSPRRILEDNIFYQTDKKNETLNYIISYYLNDTISVSPTDSLIQIISDEDGRYYKNILVWLTLGKGDPYNAGLIKEEIEQLYGSDNTTKMQEVGITLYQNLPVATVMQNNQPLGQLVRQIAQDGNECIPGIYAKTLLMMAYDSSYVENIEGLDPQMPYSEIIENNDVNVSAIVKVYPNPANDFIIAQINSDEYSYALMDRIEIVTPTGVVLKTERNDKGWPIYSIPVNDLSKGTYIIRIYQGDELLHTQLFMKM